MQHSEEILQWQQLLNSLQVPEQQLRAGLVGNGAVCSYWSAPCAPPGGSFAATHPWGLMPEKWILCLPHSFMSRLMLIAKLQTLKVINHNELFFFFPWAVYQRRLGELCCSFSYILMESGHLISFWPNLKIPFSVSLLSPVIHSPPHNCMNWTYTGALILISPESIRAALLLQVPAHPHCLLQLPLSLLRRLPWETEPSKKAAKKWTKRDATNHVQGHVLSF